MRGFFFEKLLPGLVLAVVGAVIGVLVKSHQDGRAGQMRYLDGRVDASAEIIYRPSLTEKKLSVLLDNKEIDNLSRVTVELYNFTDQDYENVAVYVELRHDDNSPVEIISEDVIGADGNREVVIPDQNVKASSTPGGKRFGYIISTVNRSLTNGGTPKASFKARYLLLGKKAPNAEASIAKKGLDVRPLDISRAIKQEWWESTNVIIFVFVLGYVILLLVLILFSRRTRNKEEERQRIFMTEQLKAFLQTSSDQPDAEELAQAVLKIQRLYLWNKFPAFIRSLAGIKKPD